MQLQSATHEDGGPSFARTGLDQVTLDVIVEHPLNAHLDVVHAFHPYHAHGIRGQIFRPFANLIFLSGP